VKKTSIWLVIRWILLGVIILIPTFGNDEEWYITCELRVYPLAYLSLFLLDSLSAWLDLVHFLFNPINMRAAFKRKLKMRKSGILTVPTTVFNAKTSDITMEVSLSDVKLLDQSNLADDS